jgi:rhodanese-related sulfurtransferase
MSQFAQRQDEFPREDEFLVICQAGGRSLRVATALAASGYSPINVIGGTGAWQSAGGAIVADGPAAPLA